MSITSAPTLIPLLEKRLESEQKILMEFFKNNDDLEETPFRSIDGNPEESLKNMKKFFVLINVNTKPYKVTVTIPETYPFRSSTYIFDEPINHPQVLKSGMFLVDEEQWAPSMTILDTLLYIYFSLNNHPEFVDPIELSMMFYKECKTKKYETEAKNLEKKMKEYLIKKCK